MFEAYNQLPESLEAMLRSALPKRSIHSVETLEGGATSLNVLIRLQDSDDRFLPQQVEAPKRGKERLQESHDTSSVRRGPLGRSEATRSRASARRE
jgi:hypothetical protein